MSFDISRIGQWAASLFVLVLGCNTDTRIEYVHDTTARIEADHNLDRPELLPFTLDGVVVAPFFRELTEQKTQLWLVMWAKSDKTVSARAAQLSGSGAQAAKSHPFPAEKTTTTAKKEPKGTQSGDMLLGEIGNDLLASLTSVGSGKLTVEVRVNPAADYRRLSFDIAPRKTKHWATH